MTNRLAASMSPYLQQHADNPVDWREWEPAAFAEARERDLPVLLSVGYAACHWCHVMAHESFEDETTAALMNERFVNIKVDREERPDVDAVYMAAVQAMTGRGGWPMTVFLTPDAEPFFAGTYFPPEPRHGSASFAQVLLAVSEAWSERRDAVVEAGQEAVRRLAAMQETDGDGIAISDELLAEAAVSLVRSFDPANAGFGGAPKFPPSMTMEHLLRHHARTGDPDSLFVAERTLEAMARGGIYDQLAGGFARYSVDAKWVVPHFEKMLYDNALLLGAYVSAHRLTGATIMRRIAHETADFLVAELRTAQGGFASSLDADTEGHEGRFYVWTPQELVDVLGVDDGVWAAQVFDVTEVGSFEHGASVLQRLHDPGDEARLAEVRARLLAARALRTPPARDDKVVAGWNGLAIGALARAGAQLDRPDLVRAADEAADLVVAVHVVRDGNEVRLIRTSRDGVAGAHAGVLEDYGCVADGLLALYAVTGSTRRFLLARDLIDAVLLRFVDEHGRFADTAVDAEPLITRPADPADNASPSGRSSVASALVTLAALTGDQRYRTAAHDALGASARLARTAPRFAGWGLAAAEALVDGPVQVAVVGQADDQRSRALLAAALALPHPGAVVAWGMGDDPEAPALLQGRGLIEGAPAAYPCRGFVCRLPVVDPSALRPAVDAMK